MNATETTKTTNVGQSADVKLNEVAAAMLGKTVDTAAAVSQFAVGTVLGVGLITLDSVNKWFASGTESVNAQVNSLVIYREAERITFEYTAINSGIGTKPPPIL